MCFSGDCQGNARNGSCVITIVGYRGNLVYRVVASIALWVTCGRFPWGAPTPSFLRYHFFLFASFWRFHILCSWQDDSLGNLHIWVF
jgi:hypothetical protein